MGPVRESWPEGGREEAVLGAHGRLRPEDREWLPMGTEQPVLWPPGAVVLGDSALL